MADIITELQNVFSGLSSALQDSGLFELLGIVMAVLIVGIIGGLVILAVLKTLKKGREYVGSTGHLGTVKINIRHQSPITGNLNKNSSFLVPDILERLKRIPQIASDPVKRQGVVDMEDLWKEDLLYPYDMKVIDSFDAELPDNDIMILSPVKLEESYVSWDDEKGEWSFTGSTTSLFRRYPKNIQCSELTEYFDVINVNKKKKRVYVLVVFTDVVNEKLIANQKGKIVKDVLRGRQVFVNMINLPNKQPLAVLASSISSLDELYKEIEMKNQKLKNVEEQRDSYHKLCDNMKTELEGKNARLLTRTMIGYDKPIIPIPPKSLYGIAIGAVVAGFASAKIAGIDIFAQYQGIEYLFLVGAIVIVVASIKLFDKKTPNETFETQKAGDMR